LSQAFVKHLQATNRTGNIVNISSVHEELPFPNFASYCTSKGGMKMLMRNLAVELGPLNIRVNNVAPGAIKTPINANLLSKPEMIAALQKNISLGGLGDPEDVAAVVAFLASDDAKYVTGSTYYVDGGLTFHYTEQ
jgi:glucose 1-dehydrogenase